MNGILQLLVFVWLNGCGIVLLLLGLRIYHMGRKQKLNRRAFFLYMAAAVWALGFGYMGIMKDTLAVVWLFWIGLAGNLLWLILLPGYLWKFKLFSKVQKWHRKLYYLISICLIFLLLGVYITYQPEWIAMPYGMTYMVQWNLWLVLYALVSVVWLVFLSGVVLAHWNKKILKREKKFLGRTAGMLLICAAGLMVEALVSKSAGAYVPVGLVLVGAVMLVFYYITIEQEALGIDTKTVSKHIYEAIPMPILIIGEQHIIEKANPFACEFFSKTAQELCGMPLEDVVMMSHKTSRR